MGLIIIQPPPDPGDGDGEVVDGVQAAYAQELTDAYTAGDSRSVAVKRIAQLLESISVASSITNILTILVDIDESVTIDDSTELTAQLFAELLDQVNIYSLVKTNADIAQGWVMNTEGALPLSEYNNFEFNSLAEYKGVLYGTSDTGLYTMSGDDDAGTSITAELSSMMLDFGSSRQKRIRSAYLGYTSTNELVLKVRSVSDGQLTEYWYKARPTSAAAPREGYMRVGQGLKSRYWQFELTNVDGGDFEVDQLELYPLFLGRRI